MFKIFHFHNPNLLFHRISNVFFSPSLSRIKMSIHSLHLYQYPPHHFHHHHWSLRRYVPLVHVYVEDNYETFLSCEALDGFHLDLVENFVPAIAAGDWIFATLSFGLERGSWVGDVGIRGCCGTWNMINGERIWKNPERHPKFLPNHCLDFVLNKKWAASWVQNIAQKMQSL